MKRVLYTCKYIPRERARKDQVKRREPGVTLQPPTQLKNATVHSLQVNAPGTNRPDTSEAIIREKV